VPLQHNLVENNYRICYVASIGWHHCNIAPFSFFCHNQQDCYLENMYFGTC